MFQAQVVYVIVIITLSFVKLFIYIVLKPLESTFLLTLKAPIFKNTSPNNIQCNDIFESEVVYFESFSRFE